MKVLHIGPKNYPPAHGGVEKSVFDLIRMMKSIHSYVFVEWKQSETTSIKVLPKGIIRQISAILRLAKKEKIDVLHFHKEGFIPHSLFVTFFTNNKCVHSIRGCAWRIKRWSWPIRLVFYILDILACLFIKRIVFVGKEDFRHFSKIIFWRNLYFNPNGVENNAYEGSQDTTKCVYIGRISPEKNILKLIEMFCGSRNTLTIYGPMDKRDNHYSKQVKENIKKYPNVDYGGVLAYSDIIPTLSKYNTFYNISFSEGMPVSVLEAGSVGLNLVLSDIPQHKDLGFPDVYYVNPHSPTIQTRFCRNSIKNKNYAEKKYSLERTVNNYLNIYQA